MSRCFIFGALDVSFLPEKPCDGDLVIAADRGYDVALSHGITPQLTLGDFDSRGVVPDGGEIIRLNVRKDDTDMEHAVSVAMDRGYTDFVIYGASGGRLDHTLGNIAVAEMIADRGGRCIFYGDESSFTVIRDSSFRSAARESGRLSVFSLSPISHGVTIRGLSYEAEGISLPRATTLGVSNAFIGREAVISAEDGVLLIVFDTPRTI